MHDNSVVFKVASENQTNFEASEVTIAIKALRFCVSADGTLKKAKRVAENYMYAIIPSDELEIDLLESLSDLDKGEDMAGCWSCI